jgi:ubiquinone/menaquinone biosynthesis C-methylase UbiE
LSRQTACIAANCCLTVEWVFPERERLRQRHRQALEQLLHLFEGQGDTVTAIRYAQRLLGLDPLSEELYRHLMRLFALNNDRASALHVYHTCVSTLQREMGADPDPATRAAYERLLLVAPPTIQPIVHQPLPAATPALIGRAREWEQLHDAWQRATDVATGSGNTAIAAARRWCKVTGIDYVPALLERARERAAAERLPITFLEADAEQLPFPDASFDVVLSSVGVMFAPNQEQAARELLRVCRSGGKVGLGNWTPTGLFGHIARTIAAYVPPPAGVKPAALWGTEERVRELFGEGVVSLQATKRNFLYRYRSVQHWMDLFGAYFGPIVTALRALDPAGQERFSHDLMAGLEQANQARDGTLVAPMEYLEVITVRR